MRRLGVRLYNYTFRLILTNNGKINRFKIICVMSRIRREKTLHQLAIALCEGRNVWFENHTIRLVPTEDDVTPCEVCEMDCLCDMDMVDLCGECTILRRKDGFLQLVTQD